MPCAFAPVTTTQRQSLEKLGKGGQAQGPLRTPRARAAQIINYDITHGHLEVWTQSANTADTNSDSRDDKARKAKEDT